MAGLFRSTDRSCGLVGSSFHRTSTSRVFPIEVFRALFLFFRQNTLTKMVGEENSSDKQKVCHKTIQKDDKMTKKKQLTGLVLATGLAVFGSEVQADEIVTATSPAEVEAVSSTTTSQPVTAQAVVDDASQVAQAIDTAVATTEQDWVCSDWQ